LSREFSVPPARDGTNTTYTGSGKRIVTLIDNIRDKNFYDPFHPDGKTFIAGFMSDFLNEVTNRNVMTIDCFDWLHRSGQDPPEPTDEYLQCSKYLGRPDSFNPKPRMYEGIFAHEYAHLLSYYISLKNSWAEEGMADYAMFLVGYDKPYLEPTNERYPGHLQVFLGFNPQGNFGGPEQSLTTWIDQGQPEILADYGCAYSFMLYLAGRFGASFMSSFHKDRSAVNLSGLQNLLDSQGTGANVQ
jgi:hypothetical protein